MSMIIIWMNFTHSLFLFPLSSFSLFCLLCTSVAVITGDYSLISFSCGYYFALLLLLIMASDRASEGNKSESIRSEDIVVEKVNENV